MKLLMIIFILLSTAQAQTVIDQVIRTNFKAENAYLIYKTDKSEIKNAELINLEHGESLLIATVPEKKQINFYTFLIKDNKGNFYSKPFSKLNSNNSAKTYKEKLDKKNKFLTERITYISNQRDKLKAENIALEKELGERINLSEIIALKTKLANITISNDFLNSTKTDLNSLLQNRKSESKDLAANSRILSQHLSDAAKVTAAAERLSIKKKETALSRFKQQLRAVEEMQQADLPSMAKQLLELRKIRAKLENTADTSNQF